MKRNRLEAFSDGVIAIIITIMVLELKVPHGSNFSNLLEVLPEFLSYILSFIYVGIYWNNHHHLIHTIEKVKGGILWANLHLLFWLSLLPFATSWMGEHFNEQSPVLLNNFVLFMAAIAYYILQITIVSKNKSESLLLKAIGKDYKGKLSLILYIIAIAITFFNPLIPLLISIIVAIIWLILDNRIETIFDNLE